MEQITWISGESLLTPDESVFQNLAMPQSLEVDNGLDPSVKHGILVTYHCSVSWLLDL